MRLITKLSGPLLFILCVAIAGRSSQSQITRRTGGNFKPTLANTSPPPSPHPPGMVWIPGGEFSMGSEDPRGLPSGGREAMMDARPIHRVYVDGFWMDKTDVTNAEFAHFVAATGYVTVAERKPSAEDFPDAKPGDLVPGSIVFAAPNHPVSLDDPYQWWRYVPGANWRHPTGPGSTIKNRGDFPVVQVAYEDAVAYARWMHGRLPTEAEWEFSARGGLTGKTYAWGDRLHHGNQWMANTHQGHFPNKDAASDGFTGISPVAKYPANAYGLFDMAGNVWQWISDWYRQDYYATIAGTVVRNPQGPASSLDPDEPGAKKRVQRGGSFLCTEEYCTRYMVGTRGKGEIKSATNHIGFRCVRDAALRGRSANN
jgi:sulfatase modifying factor 1